MSAVRRLIGHAAIAGVVLGMVAGLTLPRLEGVRAGSEPPGSLPPETAPVTTVPMTTVPATAVSATTAPATTVPATTVPASMVPATTVPASSEAPDVAAAAASEPEPLAYSVTVAAVCIDGTTPAVDVTSASPGDIRVSVGPASIEPLAPGQYWQAPWPMITDRETGEESPETVAKWDAVRLDTMEIFALGTVDLPVDCPPPPITPGPPEDVASTPGSGSVFLQWSPPAWDGGSPIIDYTIEVRPAGALEWTVVGDGVTTATSATVTGLTNGRTYMLQITAVNANGPGVPVEAKDTPRTVPTAPTLAAAPTNISGQIRLTWSAPFDGGTEITDYVIHRSLNGTSGWTLVSDGVSAATTYTATGLTNGTRYHFRVFPVNDAGTGGASNVANSIPRVVPSAARSLVAAPTNLSGQVRLTWLVPLSNGGSAIADYVIQRSPNGSTGWMTISDGVNVSTAFTVTGLTNGTRYYFRVYARNAAGQSPVSNLANAIPRFVLTAPRSLTAVPTNLSGQIRLSWLAPLSNGGRPITDYVIQTSPNGTSGWFSIADGVSAATSRTVTGLGNATRYYFRVFARTGTITGPGSNSATAIPRTRPGAPVGLVAYASYAGYSLDWIAPRANGAVITDYVVQFRNRAGWWVTYPDGVSAATSAWFAVPGYKCTDIRVAAVNAAGVGASSYVLDSCFR